MTSAAAARTKQPGGLPFWRVYLGTVVAILVPMFLMGLVYKVSFTHSSEEQIAKLLRASLPWIEERLAAANGPPPAPEALIAAELTAAMKLPVSFDHALPPELGGLLVRGEWRVLVKGQAFTAWVDTARGALRVGPIEGLVLPLNQGRWIFVLAMVIVIVGLSYGLLIRPLVRQMDLLAHAAHRFGHGELAMRAPILRHDAAGELAATFNATADRVVRLMASQRDLTRAVSHELRTPLARLRFGLELLGSKPDPASVASRIQALEGDVAELDALVEELLSFARLETLDRPPNLGEVSVQAILEGARRASEPLRPEIAWQLPALGPGVTFELDAKLVARALQNLCANAVRHATSVVALGAAIERGQLVVTVDDDGPGIPERDRERAFEPFVRLDDSRAREIGGSGLGLAIVRRIATLHGGTVAIETAPLGGARFRLVLGAPDLTKAASSG